MRRRRTAPQHHAPTGSEMAMAAGPEGGIFGLPNEMEESS
jgi:hypothetical protein